ncbi:MAG TPA: GNAT family N-acetyltransferase [Solirubrobacterales bacterium]|nr:GNAT family N-acetyltransferase [Solirubrobacterales bacterium]
MSDAREVALQRRALGDWVAMLGASSEGARTLRLDGVTAAIVPASPQRSICNSVAYSDGEALLAGLERLAGEYERAGIAAWTVWVPEPDAEVAAALERAGHKLDGSPVAMSLELERLRPAELGDLDYESGADPAELGPMNELAYGPSAAGMARALTTPPDEAVIWAARDRGELACVMATMDHPNQAPQQRRGSATPPSDLGGYFVATHPEHRGRGLASRLVTAALLDARERGLLSSSLQGSPMGRSIYTRLGYTTDFELRMYERRKPG